MTFEMSAPLFQPRFKFDSWHGRVHRFVYEESREFHQWHRISICKYFWSTVLATVLIITVYPIAWALKKLYDKSRKSLPRLSLPSFQLPSLTEKGTDQLKLAGTLTLAGLVIVAVGIVAVLAFLYAWWLPFAVVGGGTTVVLGAIGLFELYDQVRYSKAWHNLKANWAAYWDAYQQRHRKEPKPKKERPPRGPSVTMAFLRAKKGKVCPMVIWE